MLRPCENSTAVSSDFDELGTIPSGSHSDAPLQTFYGNVNQEYRLQEPGVNQKDIQRTDFNLNSEIVEMANREILSVNTDRITNSLNFEGGSSSLLVS